ncbi:MAG: thioesterase family protein [Phycisphaerales bacterium]|nr:thioesterase family protein [Phycisphaerales bacterium]
MRTTGVRVRYVECDPMGVAHHSAYPVWFEMGRTELLRAAGVEYTSLEKDGIYLAVVTLEVTYKRPARYDDLLDLETRLVDCGHVKIEHRYTLRRGEDVLATARTVLACVGTDGRPMKVPPELSIAVVG